MCLGSGLGSQEEGLVFEASIDSSLSPPYVRGHWLAAHIIRRLDFLRLIDALDVSIIRGCVLASTVALIESAVRPR